MKKNDDKKVALKLINNYADQYKRVEEEKKSLTLELNDVKMNLLINKEIIERLFKADGSDKSAIFIEKSRQEIALLNSRNEQLNKEIANLRSKLIYYEQILNESIIQYRESTESLYNKVFILENANLKKDNIIYILNSKLVKFNEKDYLMNDEKDKDNREIYVIEPSASVNLIHEDLMLYKQGYENTLQKMREMNMQVEKYEQLIEKLKSENDRLSHVEKTTGKKAKQKKPKPEYHSNREEEDNDSEMENAHWETEEWIDIQKKVGLTKEELDKAPRNKFLSQMIAAVELLIKVINARNRELHLLTQERDLLAHKNSLMNSEHMNLVKSVFQLKNEIKSLNEKLKIRNRNRIRSNRDNEYLNTNISMIENTSREEKNTQKKKKRYTCSSDKRVQCKKMNQTFSEENTIPMSDREDTMEEKNLTMNELEKDDSSIVDIMKINSNPGGVGELHRNRKHKQISNVVKKLIYLTEK